jgi:predicted DNA-binding transcriptional regulator AlpA
MQQVADVVLPSSALRERCGKISGMTVHRWVAAGILPKPIKINGRNYWRESDVDALLAKGTQAAEGGAQ